MVTVLWAVGLDRIVVLDGNCAVGYGPATDCWIVVLDSNRAVYCGPATVCCVGW
jgi:hypothetical protein